MSDIGRRLVTNTLFNFLGRFVSRLANFFLVPFILYKIGVKDFGLFALLNVFFYYASLADMGTGASLVRFMAGDVAKKDATGLERRVLGQLLFCFGVTLALAAFFHVLGPVLLSFFHLPGIDAQRMRFLILPFILGMGAGLMTNVFQSVLLGHQRMDLTNAIGIILVAPNIAGTFLFLQGGYGLEGLVAVFFIVQVMGLGLAYAVVGRVYPSLRWAARMPDWRGFAETVRLGLHLQWIRCLATVSSTLDKILLAPMLGLSAVTTYALAGKPVLLAQEVGSLIVSATVPMVAHWDSKNSQADEQRIAKLRRISQRYLNVFVAVAIPGFWLFSSFFVRLWLGPGYEQVALVMRILSVGQLISLLTTPGFNELTGRGNLSLATPILTIQTILHVALCWFSIKTIGVLGPAMALTAAALYGTAHFLIAFYRSRAKISPAAPVLQEA